MTGPRIIIHDADFQIFLEWYFGFQLEESAKIWINILWYVFIFIRLFLSVLNLFLELYTLSQYSPLDFFSPSLSMWNNVLYFDPSYFVANDTVWSDPKCKWVT